jgi:DNA repair exonuclease SbcCD nuclease subunit
MSFENIENVNARRIWFITDTHLGVRNNSNEWIDYIHDYFYKWFIPMVKEHYRPGDILLHLGDVFDSRQSINVRVLNLGIEIFESLSEIFKDGIYILVGNHDIWGRQTNDVNSLKALKWIPRITTIEEPIVLKVGGKKFFMMPWRKDHDAESELLDSIGSYDYLCCHADIRGLKFNRSVLVESGADVEKFSKFGRVYSGHIHYAQEARNIKMLGSPYEITRSDMGNKKSITLLDLSTGHEQEFINDFSPKFKKYFFSDLIEMTCSEIESEFKNNFIDIMIDPQMAVKAPLNIITDTFTGQKRLNFHPYNPVEISDLTQQIFESDGRQFEVMDFIKEYVNAIQADDEFKQRVFKSLNSLYRRVLESESESKI